MLLRTSAPTPEHRSPSVRQNLDMGTVYPGINGVEIPFFWQSVEYVTDAHAWREGVISLQGDGDSSISFTHTACLAEYAGCTVRFKS